MKKIISIILMLLPLKALAQDSSQVNAPVAPAQVNGNANSSATFSAADPGRFGLRRYDLQKGRFVRAKLWANKGHMDFNQLSIEYHCPHKNKPSHTVHLPRVCGLANVEYSEVDDSLKLHLTEYNPASVDGDCSGPEYIETIKLNNICGKGKKKAPRHSREYLKNQSHPVEPPEVHHDSSEPTDRSL